LWEALPRLDAMPSAEELGFSFSGADLCPCRPGEAAALSQLQAFADGGVNGAAP
jgi:deoxyribodipyrimidine photo-lyase